MLSLTSCALSFSAPSTLPRGLAAAARARPVFANENEMEPDGGWGVDNLMDMMDTADEAGGGPTVAQVYEKPVFNVKELPGITDPLGFFDPIGFTEGASEGKVRFYREVELKHCRVGMLAALGFLVGEQFHPLFAVDTPSYLAFQQTPLQTFWPGVVIIIGVAEIYSVFSFNSPFGNELWTIRDDHVAGDLGFDPAGLKPAGATELRGMQNAELNNGRLAMIAAAGMIVQETFVTHAKLF